MTQEDKQLLLKDLCTRLPYGVKCYGYQFKIDGNHCECYGTLTGINNGYFCLSDRVSVNGGKTYDERYLDVKPYLRPMSSMTEEEKEELKQEHIKDEKLYAECLTKAANGDDSMRGKVIPHFAADWCNKNHFDYRGLIPIGLALEAPEGMYKTE